MDRIGRNYYLNKLIEKRDNGRIKVITGIRRCGKSVLLFDIFGDYLKSMGVADDQLIQLKLDVAKNARYRNPIELDKYLRDRITDSAKHYYVMLDEIQEVEGFERIVNGINSHDNVDVYVTGSNSKFLSSDIRTIFRGRGDEVRIFPLSFKEFITDRTEPMNELWKEYYTYGGMPALLKQRTAEQKVKYLQGKNILGNLLTK